MNEQYPRMALSKQLIIGTVDAQSSSACFLQLRGALLRGFLERDLLFLPVGD